VTDCASLSVYTSPEHLGLERLVEACRWETAGFVRLESSSGRFCEELFRRAVCEGSDQAWDALVVHYRAMVLAWIRRHPASSSVREEDDYWVTRTFERFWRAMRPERFRAMRGLPALITYLRHCAHCVLLDEVRARQASVSLHPLEEGDELPAEAASGGADAADLVVSNLTRREIWSAVMRELPDADDRRVAYLSLVLDLKPQQIHQRFPSWCPDVTDAYRRKRNVLDRLRRSPTIRGFLE
jgi:DNA-directed RNA polymerase specialized sigma24 family protein